MRLAALREERNPAAARATYDELLALAPTMAGAELATGDDERDAGNLDAASAHYRRCVEQSPTAARCLSRLSRLEASNGKCDAYARDATRILVLQPDDWFFRRDGLAAALSTGAGEDNVRAAIEGVLRTNEPQRRFDEAELEGEVALWRGSMFEARDALARAERVAHVVGASVALPLTLPERLVIAEELGDEQDVRALTRAYMGARSLTTPENDFDGLVLTALRSHRVLPQEEILRTRDRWRRDAADRPAGLVWLQYDAALALTESEARETLASGLDSKIRRDRLDVNARLGHLYLVGRRFVDAASRLELVAFSCALFQNDFSYIRVIVPAAYNLGQAREGLGDFRGACTAYGRVLERWGGATPRSATAAAARARSRALHCPE